MQAFATDFTRVAGTDSGRPGSPNRFGIQTVKPASRTMRAKRATWGVIPGISVITITAGPEPATKVGLVLAEERDLAPLEVFESVPLREVCRRHPALRPSRAHATTRGSGRGYQGSPTARARNSISGALRRHASAKRARKSAAQASCWLKGVLAVKLRRRRSSAQGCSGS